MAHYANLNVVQLNRQFGQLARRNKYVSMHCAGCVDTFGACVSEEVANNFDVRQKQTERCRAACLSVAVDPSDFHDV